MSGSETSPLARARSLCEARDFERAVAECRRVIEEQPENASAHDLLGTILLRQGREKDAIEAFRTALKLAPDSYDVHHRLGIALDRSGNIEAAIREFRRTVELNPEFAGAYCNLGLALGRRKHYDAALVALQKAYSLDQTLVYAGTNFVSILLLRDRGRLGAETVAFAHRVLADFLAKRPNYAPALLRQAQIHWILRHRERALEIVTLAIEAGPVYEPCYSYRFFWLLRLARFRDAWAALKAWMAVVLAGAGVEDVPH